jgi:hypothetical protein
MDYLSYGLSTMLRGDSTFIRLQKGESISTACHAGAIAIETRAAILLFQVKVGIV